MKRATAAIQVAGSQANAATAVAAGGHTTERRHATSPSTVATGAAGSASRLATTPTTGTPGSRRSSSG
ncbi:hypothetical protein AX769_14250 [Frondihabitans sp. PAMC 28766]|nr:hypothetical protein [Frondihabitans sp. PAMC 28766]AMM21086.1 hypothetical protein AX769_14250 [Frondihabitans sp. PAMC 28766]